MNNLLRELQTFKVFLRYYFRCLKISLENAYFLFDTDYINNLEIGTTKYLKDIHTYLFNGLYDFVG